MLFIFRFDIDNKQMLLMSFDPYALLSHWCSLYQKHEYLPLKARKPDIDFAYLFFLKIHTKNWLAKTL